MTYSVWVGFEWYCYYNILDIINPVTPISQQDLEAFYSDILSLAGQVWAFETAQKLRRASVGGITLEFRSSDPIAWEWIHEFLVESVSQALGFLSKRRCRGKNLVYS